MPIGNITQTMSTISPPPHRGVDVQTIFVNKQEDFQDHLADITIDELNTLKDQLNSRIGEINSTTTTMNGYADTASAEASEAITKAGEASTSASEALTSRDQASTFATNSSNSATKASQWADNNYNVEVEAGKYSAKHWSTVAQNTVSGKVDKVASTDNAIVRFDGITGAVQNSSVIIDDSGNVGLGVPTSASSLPMLQSQYGLFIGTLETNVAANTYFDTGWKYIGNGTASLYYSQGGTHNWRTAPSGTAGNTITWTNAMTLDQVGNLLLTAGTGALGHGAGAGGTVTQLTSKSTAVTLNKPTGRVVTNNAPLASGASIQFTLNNSLINITDTVYVCMSETGSALSAYDFRTMVSNGYCYIYITNKSEITLSDAIGLNFVLFKGANS